VAQIYRRQWRHLGAIDWVDGGGEQVPFRVHTGGGALRNLLLEVSGTLDVTVATGAVAQDLGAPGIVRNARLTLNEDEVILKRGTGFGFTRSQYLFYGKTPAVTNVGVTQAAHAFAARWIWPLVTPHARNPEQSQLLVTGNDRLDIITTWGDEDSLVSGGTKSLNTGNGVAPRIDVFADIERPSSNMREPSGFFKQSELTFPSRGTAAWSGEEFELVPSPNKNIHSHGLMTVDNEAAADGGAVLENWVPTNVTLQQIVDGQESNIFAGFSGVALQDLFDIPGNTSSGIQTGFYPVPYQLLSDGMRSFTLPTGDMSDLRYKLTTTNAGGVEMQLRVLENTWEPF
jgi:hypothetical protein